MSNFDRNQVAAFRQALQNTKKLPDDQREEQMLNLIQKAQSIYGDQSPHMAIFYYEYAVYIFDKVQLGIEMFNSEQQLSPEEEAFFDQVDECYNNQDLNYQNQSRKQETEKSRLTFVQKEDRKPNVQDQKQDGNQDDENEMPDLEVCYQNLQVALKIYDQELQKIQNDQESPLDKMEVLKYKFLIHARLGNFFNLKLEYKDAIEEFNLAIEIGTEYGHPEALRIVSETHFNLGNTLLSQKKTGCEVKAINEFISAIICLIRYLNEVEPEYDSSSLGVPTLKNPKVDRYNYLQAPRDSQVVSEMKICISQILDKIQETHEKIPQQINESSKDLDIDDDNEKPENQENHEKREQKQEIFHNQIEHQIPKRIPQESESQEEVNLSHMFARLNPNAPSQQLKDLRDQKNIEEKQKDKKTLNQGEFINSTGTPVISRCGNYFACFSKKSVQVWDATSENLTLILSTDLKERSNKKNGSASIHTTIQFSPDSNYFAVVNGKKLYVYAMDGKLRMKICQIPQKKQKNTFTDPNFQGIKEFFWSENTKCPQILVLYEFAKFYSVYTVGKQKIFHLGHFVDDVQKNYSFGGEPDSQMFLMNVKLQEKGSESFELCLLSTANQSVWEVLKSYQIPLTNIQKIQITKSGKQVLLFSISFGLKVYLYDLSTEKLKILIRDESLMISGSKFSPSQKYFVIGCDDGKLVVFDTLAWQKKCEFSLDRYIELGPNVMAFNELNGIFDLWNNLTLNPFHSHNDETESTDDETPVRICPITKIQFSPISELVAVQSSEMPNSLFIYDLSCGKTIIVNSTGRIHDFKWIDIKEGPQTLYMAAAKHGVLVWKNSCYEGQIFKDQLPLTGNSQPEISEIQTGKNGSIIIFSKDQKQFIFSRLNPNQDSQEKKEKAQEKDIII